jgi:hypothetical protein
MISSARVNVGSGRGKQRQLAKVRDVVGRAYVRVCCTLHTDQDPARGDDSSNLIPRLMILGLCLSSFPLINIIPSWRQGLPAESLLQLRNPLAPRLRAGSPAAGWRGNCGQLRPQTDSVRRTVPANGGAVRGVLTPGLRGFQLFSRVTPPIPVPHEKQYPNSVSRRARRVLIYHLFFGVVPLLAFQVDIPPASHRKLPPKLPRVVRDHHLIHRKSLAT